LVEVLKLYGYVIPFVNPPVSMYFKNNKSALDNSEFVDQAVSELVDSGCVHEVPFIPYMVNPVVVGRCRNDDNPT
jgi:hypothetical protein